MKLEHPYPLAQEISRLLESDPIAAAQVKEHIAPERLFELLGIEAPEPEVEVVEHLVDMDNEELMAEAMLRFTLAEVIAAYRKE